MAGSSVDHSSRRRTAIDISPKAVQRFEDKVAILECSHLRAGFSSPGGVTQAELESLYTDMQLIHQGRCEQPQTKSCPVQDYQSWTEAPASHQVSELACICAAEQQ